MRKTTIAIIGTQGLPNKYGGFETLVEYLTKYLSNEFEITVFCSSKIYKNKLNTYNNSKLKYLPFNANGWESLLYDSISIFLSLKYDKILLLGSNGSFVMPLIKINKNKFLLNIGGIDWERSKWNKFNQKLIKYLNSLAVRNSRVIISDNKGIQEFILAEYNRESILIEYGGDQVKKIIPSESDMVKYPFLKGAFAFSVARIQQDNNIDMILDAFISDTSLSIVFVGNWANSKYGKETKYKYQGYKNIILLDAIYDQRKLDTLRSNCSIYIHGHSAGGTNPSLVEAMNLGLPICAFSSVFNKYTTENMALYFNSAKELETIISTIKNAKLESIGKKMNEIADRRYKWSIIAEKYSQLFRN